MGTAVALVLAGTLGGALPGAPAAGPEARGGFRLGADVSSLDRLAIRGATWKVDGERANPLELLGEHGFDTLRLRLFVDPKAGWEGLARTAAMARAIEREGFDLLLDLHYSDTWADPARQRKPAAWDGLAFDALEDTVRAYTARVVSTLAEAGGAPELVQIGNEIANGILFDDGRVSGELDRPGQWDRLARLLTAGAEGARAGARAARAAPPGIVLHVHAGGDAALATRFFERIEARGVPFDAIGISYYPWWHGTLHQLEETLAALGSRFGRDVLVVETGYPWTLRWFDEGFNVVGQPSQLLPGLPASPAGQRAYVERLVAIVRAAPHGRGVFWWEPLWIPARGTASPWENVALFDADGEALPALDAVREAAGAR